MRHFKPPRTLESPHLQTVLSSRAVRRIEANAPDPLPAGETVVITTADGVRLQCLVNRHSSPSPDSENLVVLVHGWLGNAQSMYVRRSAVALYRAGFNVARLMLRDHGETAHLNPELFNSACIDEVVDAVAQLHARVESQGTGLIGFSLGGNFAMRVALAKPRGLEACLAVCPVVDPAAAVHAIDRGWIGYRRYFVNKWRRSLVEKQTAFPEHYLLDSALSLSTVSALTDFVVDRYLPFADSNEYYAEYRLTGSKMAALEVPTTVVAARDDPVIPARDFQDLARTGLLEIEMTEFGGHCGYLSNWRFESALDDYVVAFFTKRLLRR